MVRRETNETPNAFLSNLLPVYASSNHCLKSDITHRVIDRGEFHQQKMKKTLSEALNVEVVGDR